MRHHRAFLLILCVFLAFFGSCQAPEETTALSLIHTMTALESALPAGDVYLLPDAQSLAFPADQAASPSVAHTSARIRVADESLLSALLGELGTELARRAPNVPITDGAFRLSTAESPCEWIVLRCAGQRYTDEVAARLLDRLALVRRQYKGTAHEALAAQGEVVIIGPFVLLVIAHDTPAALRAARHAISR